MSASRTGGAAPVPEGTGAAPAGDVADAPPATEAQAGDIRDHVPEQGGTVTNLAAGVVVAATGVFALVIALGLDTGTLTVPRAGTWPVALSAALIALGVFIAVGAKTFDDAERLNKDALGVLYGAVSLTLAIVLMPLIGFEIAAFLLLVYWMTGLGREPLKLSIPIAAASVVVFYLIFITGLRVPLPRLF